MKRFIEGQNRFQSTLLPESLDDYIAEDDTIRFLDAFVDELNLLELGFERAEPSATGRPGYHPAIMLKLYVYGYMNQIQTSRRLERESHRNVELMWLTGRLMPDFKTIADFRKDNKKAIQQVCVKFVGVCRKLELYSAVLVAIDGSKFKGVNSRDRNFTRNSVKRRMQRLQAHINRYLTKLEAVDNQEPEIRKVTASELEQKIASMKADMKELEGRKAEVEAAPDQQISLTDPDSRSMAKAGGGSTVGYNVQTAVDSKHHLIVAHEVTNATTDRDQLASIAGQAKDALHTKSLTVVADPGYYKGETIVECKNNGIQPLVPKVDTSESKARGRYAKSDFDYDAKRDVYRCPAGEKLTYRFDSEEKGKTLRVYMTYQCRSCPLKNKCTKGNARRIKRWEQENVLEAAAAELAKNPDAMRLRKQLVEHPYGTIKHWMGSTHFLMKRLENVQTEMSLHVLAYNMKRAINILGVPAMMAALETS
jgi:transposase